MPLLREFARGRSLLRRLNLGAAPPICTPGDFGPFRGPAGPGGLKEMRRTLALLLATACSLPACGDDDEPAKTVTVEREVTVENPPPPSEPRQKSRPQSTKTTAAREFVNCDPNIEAKVAT